ncbi:hypothetical protein SC1083_0483 [Aggregatibacter actinomycetemcomitans serotype e str. SC1083]|uniref:Uncharacterized protein n=1 Tax=Aggregatibacter actinomycetemcomitans serotype e str. SC1083 TaxID=907488 RepID=G4A6P3_AGGAC|nr:hypothetical protein SC1083_0483 [Aggregatibacter actinomycetemcomitans serotype e str. SC1083]KYK74725.1 hypothetical protein SA3096_04750 [Aggregatibacter actinomycetemcomitans serotype e str. SA3096]KYK82701.1 hypothetical protein SC936_00915 [Aggregatibacter actinomycetemcomitans serotype e str. SC936]KYK94059.1 hypothetical protein ANH9776_07640 [Aggregatibacter actinomycetemcomitans serotype e str. ANH9776]
MFYDQFLRKTEFYTNKFVFVRHKFKIFTLTQKIRNYIFRRFF